MDENLEPKLRGVSETQGESAGQGRGTSLLGGGWVVWDGADRGETVTRPRQARPNGSVGLRSWRAWLMLPSLPSSAFLFSLSLYLSLSLQSQTFISTKLIWR